MKSVILTVLTALIIVGACSTIKPTETVNDGCGDLSLGQTKVETCDGGQKIFVCKKEGLTEILNSCRLTSNECVSFVDVKSILTDKCLVCHFTPSPYDQYDVAKAKANAFISRIGKATNNPERMPKDPKPPLSIEERRLIERWKADGLKEIPEDCSDARPTGDVDLLYLESAIISDLARLEADDRENTRYLVTLHREGDFTQGVSRSLSSLSSEDTPYTPQEVSEGLYRLDLRSYGLSQDDWELIEDRDRFDLESFTDEGVQIKFLTGTRKVWMHFDNFIDITQTGDTYYELTGVADNVNQLLKDLGVNVAGQFNDLSAQFIGFNGSEISLQKNRLLVRFESEDGYVWITFDTEPPISDGRNLFLNPCLNGTGCQSLYQFSAGEVIYSLPNGSFGFFLFNAAGERQNEAAIELGIVQNTRAAKIGLDSQIDIGGDCHRCHHKGILSATDEIRGHVTRSGSLFEAADREVILKIYKSSEANNAIFTSDNARYTNSLDALEIDPAKDHINEARDEIRFDWSVAQIASFLLLTEEQFIQGLQGSGQGSQEVGQLLTGGRITLDQFVDILPVLKNDLRLFQEPL